MREPELSLVAREGWSEISCEIWKLVARLKPDLHVSMKRDAWDTLMEIGEDLTGWSGTECTQNIRELAQNDATLSQAIYHCFSTFTIEDKTELEDTSWLNRLERLKEKFELHDLNCDLLDAILIKAKEDLLFHHKALKHLRSLRTESHLDTSQ